MKESEVLFLPPPHEVHIESSPPIWHETWQSLAKNKAASMGLCVLITMILMAIIAPYFSHYTYYETHLPLKNLAPCKRFWFGTDELGRDIFIRIWWGARVSLFVGISAAILDMIVGVFYGALAGFSRREKRRVDDAPCRYFLFTPPSSYRDYFNGVYGPWHFNHYCGDDHHRLD